MKFSFMALGCYLTVVAQSLAAQVPLLPHPLSGRPLGNETMPIVSGYTKAAIAFGIATQLTRKTQISATEGFESSASPIIGGEPSGSVSSDNSVAGDARFSKPYPGLSTVTDFRRSVIGGFPIGDEYGAAGSTVSAITGAIRTPAGEVSGAHIFDAGVSGYAQTRNIRRDAIGLFGEGAILTDGASAYGMNTEVINCENHRASCTLGAGLNMNQLWSVEADVSLYKKGSVAPIGSAAGVVAVVYAETQPTGQFNAFQVSRETSIPGSQPWKTGLTIGDGTASAAAIVVGATATPKSVATASMPIVFETYTADDTPIPVKLYADSSQAFHVTAKTLQVESRSDPAVSIHNSFTNQTWELINGDSGDLQFHNPQAGKWPFVIGASVVSANVPMQLSPQTFSALPTCTSANAGALAYITDAKTAITAWHQQVINGGGAYKAFVTCNGSGWFAFSY